jgi:cell wall-associated NlpC family hydrolase
MPARRLAGVVRVAAALALLATGAAGCASVRGREMMAVIVPVADVRAEPGTQPAPDTHDALQETQVLYGEGVRVLKRSGEWARVEALEQPEYSHRNKWQGYPGWVPLSALAAAPAVWPRNAVITAKWATLWTDAFRTRRHPLQLPLGTLIRADLMGEMWRVELLHGEFAWLAREDAQLVDHLRRLPPDQRRRAVIDAASLFLGDRYYWGGRSPQADAAGTVTGVDCSGLTNLAHRAAAIVIPRDAHEQYLRATPVATPRPGDLVFLSDPADADRIVHVMLYAGDGLLLEGPGTGQTVRRISVEERLGQPIEQLGTGAATPGGQVIHFGSFIAS